MEKAWAIIIDDDQAACMMAIPRLFEQLPPELRKNISHYKTLPYLAYSKQTFLYGVVNSVVEENKLTFEQVFETTLSESLIKMAVNGAGVAWAPTHAIKDELEKGILTPAFPGEKKFEIPLDIVCYRSRESKREAVNIFWSTIKTISQ